MHALLVDPLRPTRLVFVQFGAGQDKVASSILDVDVQIAALHEDNGIEIDLHRVRNPLLDCKCMRFGSAPPTGNFGPEKEDGYNSHGDGPFAAAFGSGDILRF